MIVRCCLCTAAQLNPWLFVGLGNPGDKYNGTGFEMSNAFAESVGISVDRIHFKALFGQGVVDDAGVFVAKPQTYMNLSGESAGPLAAHYKMPLNQVVVAEECDLSFSRKQRVCSATNWSLLKWLRISKSPGQMDPKAFLLQKFNAAGRERVNLCFIVESSRILDILIRETNHHPLRRQLRHRSKKQDTT